MKARNFTLGIVGGGQLGRMSAMAAARLGIRTVIYSDGNNQPGEDVAWKTCHGAYNDRTRLQEFAADVDVITYEFENIPADTVSFLKTFKPVYPDERALHVSQDRIREKSFLNDTGIETAYWVAIKEQADLLKLNHEEFADGIIFKTTRLGYDGKGQVYCGPDDNPMDKVSLLESDEIIAEQVVDFMYEISAIIARDKAGNSVIYGPVKNEHENHILARTIADGTISASVKGQAVEAVTKIADTLDLVGVMALEMFVVADGEKGGRVIANEIAPRPHNSGHYSIDACIVSQFENHVRAVCGLPLGDPSQHTKAEMVNLIGNDVDEIDKWLTTKGACVHLYNKRETRPGRKMGHVTILK